MMHKRRLHLKKFLILLVILGLSNVMCVKAEEELGSKHVIVLLDTSGSMNYYDNEKEAINWVKNICALGMDTDIRFSLITFQSERIEGDEITSLFKDATMDEEMIKSVDDLPKSVEYDGTLTDHLAALHTAVDELNSEYLKNTTIVMLSDSNLDYVNRGMGSNEPLTEDEKSAIEEFQNLCKSLASKGCGILLVGFGEDVSMFQELDGIDGIRYFPKDYNISEIIREIYGGNGYDIEYDDEIYPSDGEITFDVDRNYYMSIVNFGKVKEEPVTEDDIQVYHNGEKTDIDYDVVDMDSSVILYLKDTNPQNYKVKISNCRNDRCSVWHREKNNIKGEMRVSVYDRDGREIPCTSEGFYEVDGESRDDIWPLKLSVQLSESVKAEDVEEFHYVLQREKEGTEPILFENTGAGEWNAEIEKTEEAGKHLYYIYLKINGIEDHKWVTIIESYIITEEKISTCVGEINELTDTIMTGNTQFDSWEIKVNGNIFELGEENEALQLNENGTLIFKEEGDYDVEVLQEGELVRHIIYTVSPKAEPESGYDIMPEVIAGMIIFGFMVVIIIACLVGKRRR